VNTAFGKYFDQQIGAAIEHLGVILELRDRIEEALNTQILDSLLCTHDAPVSHGSFRERIKHGVTGLGGNIGVNDVPPQKAFAEEP
jgi:hypothetical protein